MLTRSSEKNLVQAATMILFGAIVNIIDFENSEDVTSESYIQRKDRKHSRLQLRFFKLVNGNRKITRNIHL